MGENRAELFTTFGSIEHDCSCVDERMKRKSFDSRGLGFS